MLKSTEKKMYPILPLQIFKLRYEINKIKKKNTDKDELNKMILKAKEIAEIVSNEAKDLYDRKEIDGEDLHKILLAIANLFEYLNEKYGKNMNLNEEVLSMTKTLYDPEVEERGIEKGMQQGMKKSKKEIVMNSLKMELNEEIIAQITGFSIEKIREIKKELN